MMIIEEAWKAIANEILSLNRGREPGRRYKGCWIGLGPTYSMVYRLETSMEEYLAFTSDRGERVLIEQYAEQYGNMQLGIMALAGELRRDAATARKG